LFYSMTLITGVLCYCMFPYFPSLMFHLYSMVFSLLYIFPSTYAQGDLQLFHSCILILVWSQ
jgi:hypothetical protein